MTASKLMPQKSNHDFKEKYHHIHVGTLVSMRITDILFFCKAVFLNIQRFAYIKT